MLLSNNKDFLFVHVPKTGGSSIVRVLASHCLAPIKMPYRRLLLSLPRVNASPVSSSDYEFSSEEIVQINRLFADDFANFEYRQR